MVKAILSCLVVTIVAVCEISAQSVPGESMEEIIVRYSADVGNINRSYPLEMSSAHRERVSRFFNQWSSDVGQLKPESVEEQVDLLLLKNHIEYEIRALEISEKRIKENSVFLPFAVTIIRLDEDRRSMKTVQPEKAASDLVQALADVERTKKEIQKGMDAKNGDSGLRPTKFQAHRVSVQCEELKDILSDWYAFYAGYDPLFSWWVEAPYQKLERALGNFADFLSRDVAGISNTDDNDIVGDPIGREALLSELKHEMISYTPEELIKIAEREYDWCEVEMKKASRELGYGDDWLKAIEHVKNLHRNPGEQPELIRELAVEAVEFLESRDLLTIPPLAKESWRMAMMSAERQRVSPFFTGGEVISIAFPLDTMEHEQKMMSLRGNNIHFSRATVQHELIPGHHLQGFMMDRYKTYRRVFWTPFWIEGWALYWEMQLWDLGFPRSAEDRIGMLFWRMHRCARIIFSLRFHLGQMTPQECIDMLVERVGHERANATAEVRRSFGGDYPPLYQAAYMVGALQFRSLYREVVEGGMMSSKEFHDRILKSNIMPVEMVRELLKGEVPNEDGWRFDDVRK